MSDFGVSDVELAISGAIAGNQQALEYVHRLNQEPDGFRGCLAHFFEFVNVNSRKFTLVACRIWCATRWSDLDSCMKESVKSILFGRIGNMSDCANLIANAQFAFFFSAFPNEWPTFWKDIAPLGDVVMVNFLRAFCAFTNKVRPRDAERFAMIKEAMRESGYDKVLLEFALQRDFAIAGSFLRWAGVENPSAVVAVITEGLNHGNPDAVDAACVLVERGMEQGAKMELIEALDVPMHVIAMLRGGAGRDTMRAIARLVCATAAQISDPDMITPYFQVAMSLLMNEDIEVAGCVALFIQEHVKVRPEVSGVVMNAVYARIKDSYEKDIEDVSYRESLFGVVRNCFAVNPQDSLAFLLAICESMVILEEMAHCVALLEVLGRYKPQAEFVQFFVPLFELHAPLSHEQAMALAGYTNFFKAVAGSFSAPEVSNFFTKMASFAVESRDSSLSESLLSFTKKHKEMINVGNEVICGLTATLDPHLATTSAVLIRQSHPDLFVTCLKHLSEKLQTDASLCTTVLCFVKTMHYEQGSPHVPVIKGFLEQVVPHIVESDTLQALFVRTCFSSLGSEGIYLISKCVPSGCLSIAALSKVTLVLQSKETAASLIASAFARVEKEVAAIEDVDIVNDDVLDLVQMLRNYFQLVAFAFDPVSCANVIGLAKALIVSSQLPILSATVLGFATSIARTHPDVAATAFLEPSLLAVVNNRCYGPRHPGWAQLSLLLAKFHSVLIAADGADAIQGALKSLGATDEMVKNYISILVLRGRPQKEAVIKFMSDFVRFRLSLNVFE